ncbi:MAG: hypothetical protein R2848_00395 [Thermomicrobiales bacterium]
MGTYILRRLLMLIPVMLIVGIVVFMLVHLTPGDPRRGDSGSERDR